MQEKILDVRELHVQVETFEGLSKIVDGLSIAVNKGETVGLVGETGCGKSLTSKAVLRLLPSPPAHILGKIFFRGKNVLDMDENEFSYVRGKGISMIPQHPHTSLNPLFAIGKQLADVILYQGKVNIGWGKYAKDSMNNHLKNEVGERSIRILEELMIPSPQVILDRYPHELSGGMKQRVLIAMALVGNPDLLIADEPGTALDVTVQDRIIRLLKERIEQRNLSVLYITHNLAVAKMLCHRIYVMYAGRIVESANVGTVFENPLHPYTVGLIKSVPRFSGGMGRGIDGWIPDYVNPPQGCRFYPRCDSRMPICQNVPQLDEVEKDHWVSCYLYRGKSNDAN
jgi:oligopeptide/dipeptide ABC transporter ATP-binding protein